VRQFVTQVASDPRSYIEQIEALEGQDVVTQFLVLKDVQGIRYIRRNLVASTNHSEADYRKIVDGLRAQYKPSELRRLAHTFSEISKHDNAVSPTVRMMERHFAIYLAKSV
jgi:hypothetical protein